MKKQKMTKFISCFLVALYFCLLASCCHAASADAAVTEEELNQLSQILTSSQNLNQQSQADLKIARQALEQSATELAQAQSELVEARTELEEVKTESAKLKTELTLLSSSSKQQTQSLQKVNESLKEYAAEVKAELAKKDKIIKGQRILTVILLGAGAVYVLRN